MKKPDELVPLLLDKHQVARLVGLSVRTICRLTSRGVLKRIKPAGMRCSRWSREAIVEWVRRGCPDEDRRMRR